MSYEEFLVCNIVYTGRTAVICWKIIALKSNVTESEK